MVTASVVATPLGEALDLSGFGRRSAQAAAALTIGGVVSLAVFFATGEPWALSTTASRSRSQRQPYPSRW